ncbi:GGDEF domain-containing protein [Shinella sp. JR1-6]|jgi:diguanylate cyclase (GGDEF)-like protein|uniref:GGDEF domain-containing protein n=1 Tax=Shinella sp. JR1-6 TaxID=2527671 RepID=UPI001404A707|nr:GGDEF domain-containing protein [Shinella sp. JR1-6]
MRGRLALWLRAQWEAGVFQTRADISMFVLNTVLVTITLATAGYLMATAILANFGLLPNPFAAALGFDTPTTVLVAASVSALIAWLLGMAVHEMALSRAELERLSRLDSLSGLLNRRAFIADMAEKKVNGFFVLFDVDRFKLVNDTHGQAVGDAVIVAVADELERVFAAPHLVGRVGGEEFAVFIENDDRGDCSLLVEEARRSVAARRVAGAKGPVTVTLSAGIADRAQGRSFEAIFEAADRALYLAKSLGRDRTIHEDEGEGLLEPSRRVAAGGRRR